MKTWIQLYDYYLNDVPGCSHYTAQNALRMAAQEFCERTKCWRVVMDPALTVAGIQLYDFDMTSEQELVQVLSCKLDEKDLTPLRFEDRDNGQAGLIPLGLREFWLQPAPAASGTRIDITAVIKPSNTSTGLDDFIYAGYARQIAQGAKARLFDMANQPFSNPDMAQKERNGFVAEMDRVSIQVARAFSSAPLRTEPSFL